MAAYHGGTTTKTRLAALPTASSLAPGRPSTGVEDKEAAHGRNANVDGFFVWNGVPEVAGRSRTTKAESEGKRSPGVYCTSLGRLGGIEPAQSLDRFPLLPGLSGHLCVGRTPVWNRRAPRAGRLRVRSSESVDSFGGHSLAGAWQ